MTWPKRLLFTSTLLLGLAVLAAAGIWNIATARIDGPYDDIRGKDLPVPWPLDRGDEAALVQEAVDVARVEGLSVPPDPRELVDLVGAARTRAIERGRYLGTTVGNCLACHGEDLGGAVTIDDPMLLRFAAPNLTRGRAGGMLPVEAWDRAVRHGVGPDGRALLMPSIDFAYLADRDISDLVAWATSLPPVEREVPPTEIGPVMAAMIATGRKPLDVTLIDHDRARPDRPPQAGANTVWGAYIVQTCKGCHGPDLSGGVIPGAPPDWPAASNLTPHATGLAGWTQAQFDAAVRRGVRPDGTTLHPAMPLEALSRLEDRDVEAMWMHLQEIEPLAFGSR